DAKTAEATAKSNSDKATQALADEKAKTADLNKKVEDLKAAQAKAEEELRKINRNNNKSLKKARKNVDKAKTAVAAANAKFDAAKKVKLSKNDLDSLVEAEKQEKFFKEQLKWDEDWAKSMIKTKASVAALKKRKEGHESEHEYWVKKLEEYKKIFNNKLPKEAKAKREAQKKLNDAIKNRDDIRTAIKNDAALKAAQAKLNKIKAALKAAQAKLDANAKTISNLDKANKSATTALNTAKATTKAAQAKLDANTKTISDLDKANKSATTALNTAKATTKAAQAKLDANTKTISDLDKANKSATTALNTAKATTKAAQAKLDANTKTISDLD
ncbi:hypothetical protein C4B25_04725, partial [Mycoplasma todarodis]